ncbi:molybdopterin-synthase adenylyltransferase MoeB [Arthrobacter castelli]|uniref:molybdopterin-synthase adenylyltransferase MoeB n=1 Tax=Arthrobacter castelli TaxID=271431 RepID=UPI0003FDB20C|nr:molybdopterin-synthase adenylyltransferase MoeB [Arthrobacter castelli]
MSSQQQLPPLVEPGADLTVDEIERYSRHLIIPEVGMTGQRRLKNARVLVIGAGGLGSPALLYLAAAGVGTIGIVDDDVVDTSNLQRQVIHGVDDVGRLKAESARDAVARLNPLVDVVLHVVRLDSTNALDIFSGYDLILDGTDNFATRYLVNDAAAILGKPYVWGSIYRFDGQISVFWDKYGPNYRDLYPEAPPPGSVPSCAEGGVLGMLPASVGSVMVTEAIKLITGTGETLLGRLMIYDSLAMRWREVRVRKDPDAEPITHLVDYEAFCGILPADAADAADSAAISVRELAGMLEARGRGDDDFELIDVREPGEYEIVNIPGSVLVPKAKIIDGDALARFSGRKLVFHCKSGARSAEALAVAQRAGFDSAVHVDGGVAAWVEEIEPAKPSY